MMLLKTPLLILAVYICSRNKKDFPKNSFLKSSDDDANNKSFDSLGLANLGNTCFMNSVLQSLFSARLYRNNVLMQEFTKNSVGDELKRLFNSMQDKGGWFANPLRLAKALGINVWIQQDAEELLLDLVNRVDSSIRQPGGQALPSSRMRFDSYQCIDCLDVNYTKHKTQKNMDLSVNIKGHTNLQEALRAHFKPEYLTGDDRYQTKEFGLQDATRSISLIKPTAAALDKSPTLDKPEEEVGKGINEPLQSGFPEVLVLHLKRFEYDPATATMRKVGDLVDIPLTLNLADLAAPDKPSGSMSGTSSSSSGASHRIQAPPRQAAPLSSSVSSAAPTTTATPTPRSGEGNSGLPKAGVQDHQQRRWRRCVVEEIATGLPAAADSTATKIATGVKEKEEREEEGLNKGFNGGLRERLEEGKEDNDQQTLHCSDPNNSSCTSRAGEYTLSSIIIHKGTLDSGHYYALCRVRDTAAEVKEKEVVEVSEKSAVIGTCSVRNNSEEPSHTPSTHTPSTHPADPVDSVVPADPVKYKYKWLKFNDHIVSEITEEEALAKARGRIIPGRVSASRNAYLVFYTRNF